MIWKLLQVAEQTFGQLKAPELLRPSTPMRSMWMKCRIIAPPGRRSPPDPIYTPINKIHK